MIPKLVDEKKSGAQLHEIRPEQIDTSRPFFDVFHDKNAAIVAMWLVRLAKHIGGWHSFTRDQFQKFYEKNDGRCWLSFDILYPGDLLALGRDDLFRVSDEFIRLCARSNPKSAPIRLASEEHWSKLMSYGLPVGLTHLIGELILTITNNSQRPDATPELIALAKEYLGVGLKLESETGYRLYEVMVYLPKDTEVRRSFFTLVHVWPEGKLVHINNA